MCKAVWLFNFIHQITLNVVIIMSSGAYNKRCKSCSHMNHFNCKKCKKCGAALLGRPTGTKTSKGYVVGQSGGRPTGTTVSEGYGVGQSGGRPAGTTASEGYGVSHSGGRPAGTTASEGYGVSRSGGRPVGTTPDKGYGIGKAKPKLTTFISDLAVSDLRAVPNCTLSFEYRERGNSTKERRYCCSHPTLLRCM